MLLARIHSRTRSARRGMTIVESALVMSVFLLLLFGIFEYCRFLLVLHLTNNAARDGARYAAVRVNCDPDQITIVQQSVIDYTTARMGGIDKHISDYKVAVYAVDQAGLDLTPPIIRAKSSASGSYPDPFLPPTSQTVAWNSVSFTERVAVTIKGTYKPIMPSFLFMPSSIPIHVTAMMAGES